MSSKDQFKAQYQRAVDELEHLKLSWDKERKALQRAIAKLVIPASGTDAHFDQLLKEVRLAARGKASRDVYTLNQKIDDLEKGLVGVEERRKCNNHTLIEAFQGLNAQFRQLVNDDVGKQAVHLLEGNMVNRLKSHAEPLTLQWLNILSGLALVPPKAANVAPRATEAVARKGLLNKLLNPAAKPSEKQSQTQANEAQDAEANAKKQELTAIARACTEICHSLYTFLIDLDPPEALEGSAKPLLTKLKKNLSVEEIPPAIKSISEIAIGTLQYQGEDFETFLKNTEKSLTTINETLNATGESRKAMGVGGERLDMEIRDQMQSLSDDIESATELVPLKEKVQANISSINGKLCEYQNYQVEQEQSLMGQLKLLVDKVTNMEIESKRAEQALESQIAKTYVDALTQIANRAAYENRILEEHERWKRYGHPLSVVMCDIDEFKSVNDVYGHQAGDKVLKIIGTTLKQQFRKTDFVARYGGEEFIAILPETNQEQAALTAEKVRKAVGEIKFRFRNEKVTITASFGIASFEGNDATPVSVVERADQALYLAKNRGRNRVVQAT